MKYIQSILLMKEESQQSHCFTKNRINVTAIKQRDL